MNKKNPNSKCWSLSNLQPLWAFDNISKGNKIIKPQEPILEP